ncbi:MAG TPA: hypothetical protein VH251_05960, partial [Verrucomicrobiae bacterium]|nr:hypothetical protein [Verrucomicrobiae bacterium]
MIHMPGAALGMLIKFKKGGECAGIFADIGVSAQRVAGFEGFFPAHVALLFWASGGAGSCRAKC